MNLKSVAGWWWEVLCLVIYLAIAGDQLFTRPITGMADNGDFPKVLSPFSICDPGNERDENAYIYPVYVFNSTCRWDPQLPSSELIFARILKKVAVITGRNGFRVTGAGKCHLTVVLAGLVILLTALHYAPKPLRFGLPPLVILIFSDVAYVAYMNSFYMDAASLVFLLLTVALAGAWVLRPRTWVAVAYGVAGGLMAWSKTQHVITGFCLAALAAWFASREFRRGLPARRNAWWWAASASSVALTATLLVAFTPRGYKAEPLYSLIFFRLLPDLPDRRHALKELGIPEFHATLSGTHAYTSGAPIADIEWRLKFLDWISYRTLARYYLRNPRVTLHLIWRGLKEDVAGIRPGGMGNYARNEGFPPYTLAHRFSWWSSFRGRMLSAFPLHVVIFYAIMGAGSFLCLFRKTWAELWPLYPLVLLLTISGTVEYLFPVLLDGTETSRHLFLFHVITEVLNVCAFSALLCLFVKRSHV